MLSVSSFFFIFILVFIDQVTKHWAVGACSFFIPIEIIPSILSFQLVYNHGAAYGIFQHQRLFLIIVSGCVSIGGIVFSRYFIQSKWSYWGLIFLLSGAIGNLIDRVWLGYVIDFIDIHIFPVLNLADVMINIGVILFVLEMVFAREKKYSS